MSEAARISGLSPSHLRYLVRRGTIWGQKIGRNWVTTEQAVREYKARGVRPGPKPRPKDR
ncbi:MAG: helix-turn-helix domain-containing protein [Chloroflexi bacterium]|nr:helix-turn-helix domain-containing protein [Chloroflexota bacterium]